MNYILKKEAEQKSYLGFLFRFYISALVVYCLYSMRGQDVIYVRPPFCWFV